MATIRRLPSLLAVALVAATTLGACGSEDGAGGPFSGLVYETPSSTGLSLSTAVTDGPYSDVLVDCVNAPNSGGSCTLEALPLLGMDTSNPTVDDIMNRTVVSHTWMAERFRDVLERVPADMLQLFGSVTAVVIAADIRPSYYSPSNGAIHLDPAEFWTTTGEKATVSTNDDFRSDYGNSLGFVGLWRYMDGNDYAWDSYSLGDSGTRTVTDLVKPAASLLYHELAHANDLIPQIEIDGLDPALSVLEAAILLENQTVSAQLTASQPLNSQLWKDLAQVLYKGATASTQQRALTPLQVGLELESDGASDDYAYSTMYEDTAMLFEEVMMHHHYNIDREIAYTDTPPAGEEAYCDSYIIRWGFRSRVGDTTVKARAETALQLLLDQTDVSGYFAGLGTPTSMGAGMDWCTESLGIPEKLGYTGTSQNVREAFRLTDRSPRH